MTDLKIKGIFGAFVIFTVTDFKFWRISLVNISVGMVSTFDSCARAAECATLTVAVAQAPCRRGRKRALEMGYQWRPSLEASKTRACRRGKLHGHLEGSKHALKLKTSALQVQLIGN